MAEQKQSKQWDKNTMSYVECTSAACLGPGIWMFGRPGSTLTDDNWESSYHPRGAAWPHNVFPYCQCCYEASDHKTRPRPRAHCIRRPCQRSCQLPDCLV